MSWDRLDRELAAWAAEGREATFWWRDDDAVAATPALDRLLRLTESGGVPLALAVIPAPAEPGLAERLATQPQRAFRDCRPRAAGTEPKVNRRRRS